MLYFGIHVVASFIDKKPQHIKKLWAQENCQNTRVKALIAQAQKGKIPIEFIDKKALNARIQNAHQGIAIEVLASKPSPMETLIPLLEDLQHKKKVQPFLLILDGVMDPHNFGACIRTAECAGVHGVIFPKDKSCGLTAAVSRVACGAAERLELIQVTNLSRCLTLLKKMGVWLTGASCDAEQSLYEKDLTGPIAIIMGSENRGLRRLTQDHCDQLLKIPMHGEISSLNVSVATGICLFEAMRQRV